MLLPAFSFRPTAAGGCGGVGGAGGVRAPGSDVELVRLRRRAGSFLSTDVDDKRPLSSLRLTVPSEVAGRVEVALRPEAFRSLWW